MGGKKKESITAERHLKKDGKKGGEDCQFRLASKSFNSNFQTTLIDQF